MNKTILRSIPRAAPSEPDRVCKVCLQASDSVHEGLCDACILDGPIPGPRSWVMFLDWVEERRRQARAAAKAALGDDTDP